MRKVEMYGQEIKMISESISLSTLCKECLGKPKVVKWKSASGNVLYSIQCRDCDNSTILFKTKEEALDEWKRLACENEYDDEMRYLSDEERAEYKEILDNTFKPILEALQEVEKEKAVVEKALELAVSDVAVDCRRCPINHGESCSVGMRTCNTAIKEFYLEKVRAEK